MFLQEFPLHPLGDVEEVFLFSGSLNLSSNYQNSKNQQLRFI
jgi:hypothetical protein